MSLIERAKPILINLAYNKEKISYSELAIKCGLSGNRGGGPSMFQALDEVSRQEVSAGNGMLSALVVRKVSYGSGLGHPGPGFFELARRLGLLGKGDGKSEREFWEHELAKVFRKNSR